MYDHYIQPKLIVHPNVGILLFFMFYVYTKLWKLLSASMSIIYLAIVLYQGRYFYSRSYFSSHWSFSCFWPCYIIYTELVILLLLLFHCSSIVFVVKYRCTVIIENECYKMNLTANYIEPLALKVLILYFIFSIIIIIVIDIIVCHRLFYNCVTSSFTL